VNWRASERRQGSEASRAPLAHPLRRISATYARTCAWRCIAPRHLTTHSALLLCNAHLPQNNRRLKERRVLDAGLIVSLSCDISGAHGYVCRVGMDGIVTASAACSAARAHGHGMGVERQHRCVWRASSHLGAPVPRTFCVWLHLSQRCAVALKNACRICKRLDRLGLRLCAFCLFCRLRCGVLEDAMARRRLLRQSASLASFDRLYLG